VHPDVGTGGVQVLVSELSAVIAARLVDWYGSSATLSAAASVRVRPWSILVRFPIRIEGRVGGADALLVKVRRHPDYDVPRIMDDAGLRAQGRNEFDALRRLESLTRGSDAHCAIRAVEYLDRWNALVMEELSARTLKTHLRHPAAAVSRRTQHRLEEVFVRAGSLLRVFHDGAAGAHDGPIVDADAMGSVTAGLDEVEQSSRDRLDVDGLRAVVGRVVDLGPDVTVPYAPLHCDFNCANIMVDANDRVALLDPRLLVGPVYRDLARLVVDLETFNVQAMTHGLYLRRSAETFAEAVPRGYFGASPLNRVALEFFIIVAILDKWRYDSERKTRATRPRVLQLVDDRAIVWRRRLLERLLKRQHDHLDAALGPYA